MSKYKHLNFTLGIPENYLECDKKEATHYLLMSGEIGTIINWGEFVQVNLPGGPRRFTEIAIQELGAIACFLKKKEPLKITTELIPVIGDCYGTKIININHLNKLKAGVAYKFTIEEIQDDE